LTQPHRSRAGSAGMSIALSRRSRRRVPRRGSR
jgi:hypothetical protein